MPGTRSGNKNKNKKNVRNSSPRGVKRGAAGSNRKTTKKPKELSGFGLFIQKAKDKLSCDPFPTRAHEVSHVNCLNKYALLIITGALVFTSFVLVCIGSFVINARKGDPRPNDTFSADILSLSVVLLIVGLISFSFTLCGFVGVLRENIILIRVFYVSLIVLISIKLVLLLLVLFFTSTARSIIGNAISDSIVLNYRDNTDIEATMDYMQSTFSCCGLRENGFKDWARSIYFNCSDSNPSAERCGVPWSCCRNGTGLKNALCGSGVQHFDRNIASRVIYTRSCLLALQKWCKTNALAVTVLLIFEAVFLVIVIFQCTHMVNELQMMTHVYRGPWWDWVCKKKSKVKPKQKACEAGNSDDPTSVPEIVVEVPEENESMATPMNTYPRGIISNINETKTIGGKPSVSGDKTDKDQSVSARQGWERAPAVAVLHAAADKVELEEVDLKSARKSVDVDQRRSSDLPPVGNGATDNSTPKAEAKQKDKTGFKASEKEYAKSEPRPEEKQVSRPDNEAKFSEGPLSSVHVTPDSTVSTLQETEKYHDVRVRQSFEQRKSVSASQEPTPPGPQKERQRSVPDRANPNEIPTPKLEKGAALEPNMVPQTDDSHEQSAHVDTVAMQKPVVIETKHSDSSMSSTSSDERGPAVSPSFKESRPVHPPKRAQRKSRRKTEIIKNTRKITKKDAEKKQKRLSRSRRETVDVTNSSEAVATPDDEGDSATLPAWLDGEYKYKYKRATLTPSNHEDTKAIPEGRRGDGGSVSRAVSMQLNAALNNPAAHDEVESTRLMTSAVNLMRNSPTTSHDKDHDNDDTQLSTLGPRGIPDDDW